MPFSFTEKVVNEAIERWNRSRNVLIGRRIGHVGVDNVETGSEDDGLKHFSVDDSSSADNVDGGELNHF